MPALAAVLRLLDVVGVFVGPVAEADIDKVGVDDVDEFGVVVACVAVLVLVAASAEF